MLEEWSKLEHPEKFQFVHVDSLDGMKAWDPKQFEGFDTFFCCLGGRTKDGKAQFYKSDFTYFVEFGELAKIAHVPHYSLISSAGASPSSWFQYFKVKGLAEVAIQKLGLEFVSIFRPGLLLHRRNDSRIGEKIGSIIPFISKISAVAVAQALMQEAMFFHFQAAPKPSGFRVYTNKEMLHLSTT